MSLLSKLFSLGKSARKDQPEFDAELAPDAEFFVVGDIHGCLPALEDILDAIHQESSDPTIICVGDFIDRGEQSAEVLQKLFQQSVERKDKFVCLLGNHDEMILNFLDNPESHGKRWLRYGGLQTLASFGIGMPNKQDLTTTRNALETAMGPDLINWLRNLPLTWSSGNITVTHAGANPSEPITAQSRQYLLWGHPDFRTTPRADGVWVVHGHTIVDEPEVRAGRIAVDTGAYATNWLTAARIAPDGVTFLRN